MGHINHDYLHQMVKEGMVEGIELIESSKPEFCESCIHRKATHKPFPKLKGNRAAHYGGKIISDLWGVKSLRNNLYAHMHCDQWSSEDHVTFLMSNAEAFQSY